jgi:hypothetical protein
MTTYDIESHCRELAAAALADTRLADSPRLIGELALVIGETVRRWVRAAYHDHELTPDDHARRTRRDAVADVPRRFR